MLYYKRKAGNGHGYMDAGGMHDDDIGNPND
jgi:hypothetical protein